jgi:putative transposase
MDELRDRQIIVNHKRVQLLMKMMGLRSVLPRRKHNTTIPNPENSVRPYLLKGLTINARNQVWATDITYIKLPTGMVYLFALIDWHTRFVVGWKLANTMEAHHALEVLEQALKYATPEIINSDQGSQFTGKDWIQACEVHGIKVSHDGVGRCIDNIRVERLCSFTFSSNDAGA